MNRRKSGIAGVGDALESSPALGERSCPHGSQATQEVCHGMSLWAQGLSG